MSARRAAVLGAAMLVFLPVCVVVYQLTVTVVGSFAEPIVAPLPAVVIIDHFHVEVYLEALFLTACLAVRLRPPVVWGVGALGIPILPVVWHLVYLAAGGTPLEHRSFRQDATLWAVEGISAGIVSCAVWELVRRALPPRGVASTPL
jgi:hypothetical protein